MIKDCEFCNLEVDKKQKIWSDKHIKILYPKKPIIKEHFMLVPKRHIKTFDELSSNEFLEIRKIINFLKKNLSGLAGFNIICNNGIKAGQKIPHLHLHFFGRLEAEPISPFEAMKEKTPKLSEARLLKKVQEFRDLFKKMT